MRGDDMAGASGRGEQPPHQGKAKDWRGTPKDWLGTVFALNPAGLNWPRAVIVLDAMLVPLVLFWAIGYEQYLFSALFGMLFAAALDPGGSIGQRAARLAVFGLVGAGVTALGFGIGADAWGWVVLAVFAVTLVAGLAAMFGAHRFIAGFLLNIWFMIALSIAFNDHQRAFISSSAWSYTWAQTAAWAGGTAVWIAVAFIAWLVCGFQDQPRLVGELPDDTARRELTRPLIMFALLRALVMAGTVAIAFGANLPHGQWMPIAAIIAMRPGLEQSAIFAAQRLAGALVGAGAAIMLLLIPANVHGLRVLPVLHGLEVVVLVLMVHAVGTRFANYALYCAFIAAAVLTLLDLPQPTNYSAEGYRVLWTFCGVGIALVVTVLAGLLVKRAKAKAPPEPAKQPAH
jgi:uncharacterized membrane protein YccC